MCYWEVIILCKRKYSIYILNDVIVYNHLHIGHGLENHLRHIILPVFWGQYMKQNKNIEL